MIWARILYFIVLGLWLITAIMTCLTLSNTSYCYIFEREKVKKYNYLINLPITSFKRIKFLGFHAIQAREKPEWVIVLDDKSEKSWVTSKDKDGGCILSDFYVRGSKKLYNKLKDIEIV